MSFSTERQSMMRLDSVGVGVMINRTRVAAFVAALALVSTCATAEARGGGGGHGGSFHGGLRGPAFHGGFHRVAPRPVMRVAPGSRHVGGVPAHRGQFRHRRHDHFARHHRNRNDDTGAGVNVYYGGSGDDFGWYGQPTGAVAPAVPTAADGPTASGPLCRSADQMVPRERGGQTLVTVTRCYPPEE